MPSPFPGMNPYLEQEDVWHDFHERFIPAAAEMLLPQIRPNYIVKIDEHAYIHELPADNRRPLGRPDIALIEKRAMSDPASSRGVIQSPVYGAVPLAVDIEGQSYLEVRDRTSREIITVIELLSPSNKRPGGDRTAYLAKRQEFLRSRAHLVEIDLLRGGPRLPVEGLPAADYYALVSRSNERPRAGIWPIKMRDPLPVIPIPLRGPDADAMIDLQKLVLHVYEAAGYEDYIYSGSPQPPLSDDDASWAAQLAKQSG